MKSEISAADSMTFVSISNIEVGVNVTGSVADLDQQGSSASPSTPPQNWRRMRRDGSARTRST
jgi:hypothetical protein